MTSPTSPTSPVDGGSAAVSGRASSAVGNTANTSPVATGPGRSRLPRFLRATEYYATLFSHFWKGSIVTIFVSPMFYLLAMGLGVGALVDARESAQDSLGGLTYLQYVAPGMLAAAAMQSAAAGSLYPVMASVKWLRTAYGVTATPIRPVDLAWGYQTWLAIQAAVGSIVFAALISIAGAVNSWWIVAVPPVAALGALAYSAPMSAWAIGRETDHSFSLILRFGVLPSFLLSGTFFPVSQLPAVLEVLAVVAPLWHSVELVRDLAAGTVSPLATIGHLAVLAGYATVGLLVAKSQYTKRLYP